MGGSKSSDKKKTTINTTTTTSMGDIGLTGQNAVDLAAVLSTGAIEQTRISAASLDNIIQMTGASAQQLVGGASELVKTQGEIASRAASGQSSDLVKIAPFLAIAAVVLLTLKRRKK